MKENKEVKEKKPSSQATQGAPTQGAKSSSSGGKSLMVVALRNKFFFMFYRYSTLVFLTSVIAFISSIVFMILFARQPVAPQYIPLNEDGTLIKLEPLSVCKPDEQVIKFTVNTLRKLYKYDYINYADQIQSASQNFMIQGWNAYLDEFSKSNVLFAVKENKWVSTIDLLSVPQIVDKKEENGICMWDVKTEIILSYIGERSQKSQGNAFLRIQRNSVINNPEGLGVTKVLLDIK